MHYIFYTKYIECRSYLLMQINSRLSGCLISCIPCDIRAKSVKWWPHALYLSFVPMRYDLNVKVAWWAPPSQYRLNGVLEFWSNALWLDAMLKWWPQAAPRPVTYKLTQLKSVTMTWRTIQWKHLVAARGLAATSLSGGPMRYRSHTTRQMS